MRLSDSSKAKSKLAKLLYVIATCRGFVLVSSQKQNLRGGTLG